MRPLIGIALFAAACTGDITDIGGGNNGGNVDMAMPTGDMTMPTGGVTFAGQIEADIESAALGCTGTGGCHGAGVTPQLKVGDIDNNYMNFKSEAMNGEMSNVLQKNLQTSQLSHSVKPFQTTSDPIYQRWLAWINAGNPKGP
jgi:hypothetical protein